MLSHNHTLRSNDTRCFSASSNRLKYQTPSLATQSWYIPWVLFQVLLLLQLPMSVPLLRPAPRSPEGRPCSSQCAPAIPRSPARDYSQGYRTSPCGLTDNFPTELNSLTKMPQKAAALSSPPSQTREVLQTTGTIALRTPRGKGTPICIKYPLFVRHAFSGSWTAMSYYLLLRQCCLFRGCCFPFGMLEMNNNFRVKRFVIIMSLRGLSKASRSSGLFQV